MKFYITRQFKKFMKNANAKGIGKDRMQSSCHYSRAKTKGKRMLGMAVTIQEPRQREKGC
ncbi:hypothetical protein SO802_017414 [Lithocarpus litseifolius]|uniref:Uncharacterized protein n=1 Tax=Lithocarpus litseifolius TaxID=425828 RepID=A0AAW2CJ39_9ROSI